MIKLDDRRFHRIVLLALSAGFLLLLTAFVVAVLTLRSNQSSNERVDHTYQVIEGLARLEVQVERAETASRGFLLIPDPVRAMTFRESVGRVMPTINRIAGLTSDNPSQQRNVTVLRRQATDELRALDLIMNAAEAGQLDEARALFAREVQYRRVNGIRDVIADLRSEEQRLLAERSEAEARTVSLLNVLLATTGILLFLIGGGVFYLVRRYTVDLTHTRDQLHLLNTDLEGAVTERTANLRRANEEIQRFAYIVSHDLRSPLVNIMGFTAELQAASDQLSATFDRVDADQPQLIDEPSRLAVKEDLPEAVGFIRSSTQKMDRLINAILRLSREGRRTLNPEHLPMDRVVGEIIASFEQQLSAKDAQVTIAGKLPDIHSDRVAVEQILSNLIENAIKYGRGDGSGHIEVRGERHGSQVSFLVADNGRGIAPGDHERVFDLFRRSGTQDQPGEGLGLAHVRALAYRLGGTVTIDSALGEGSTFRLTLPVTYFEREATA